MHIIIGVITALAGFFWALHSLQNAGVDLNAFNPFTWMRRRKWAKKLGTKPMHALTDSMDAAALLVLAVAKAEGEITRETKMEILELFEREFGIKRNRSIELFSSSVYFLDGTMNMAAEVKHVLAPSKREFQPAQVKKLLDMLTAVASLEGGSSARQAAIIDAVGTEFEVKAEKATQW